MFNEYFVSNMKTSMNELDLYCKVEKVDKLAILKEMKCAKRNNYTNNDRQKAYRMRKLFAR